MLFSTPIFLFLFLPVNIIIYYLIKDSAKNYFLLLTSLYFYSWGEPRLVLVMLVSIAINYICGLLVSKYKKKILILTIIINIGSLIIFKYLGFFINNLNNLFKLELKIFELPLPIGISFFTFQAMSYVIDVYRKEVEPQKNIFNLALYISFFPQLIAGPIVRYKDINKEIEKRNINYENALEGLERFFIGLIKKVLIANILGEFVDKVYLNELKGISIFLSIIFVISYTLQIYFDFSAYSDMAIGLGKIFGFKFLENFNYPYTAKSIKEFWRRWHISLSSWFRDYLYIPLGGNRKGKFRKYLNQILVFSLCGFWHGASWNFIIWGLIHGIMLTLESLEINIRIKIPNLIKQIYTLIIVMFSWIFFRADNFSDVKKILKGLFGYNNFINVKDLIYINNLLLFSLFLGIVLALKKIDLEGIEIKEKKSIRYLNITLLSILAIIFLASNSYNPFIYFRF